jgi:hypothetical protein
MDSIMEAICRHETDSLKGKTPPERLPNFDDVTQYGASEEQEKKLWTLEAERLLKVVECHEMPLEFDGEGILGESNEEGYQRLSDLGDQILCNFRVCLHDSQLLALEFCPDLCDVKAYRRLKRFLESRFDESPSEQQPKLLKVRNTEAYCALVDHITTVAARLVVHSAESKFWHTNCLAVLAKWATKLKYLSIDPVRFTTKSLDAGTEVGQKEIVLRHYRQMAQYGGTPDSADDDDGVRYMPSVTGRHEAFAPEEDRTTMIYFLNMVLLRECLSVPLQFVLSELRGSKLSGFSVDAFEISSLVYGTGFTGYPTLLSQDRDGSLCASSLSFCVRNSYSALQILRQTIKSIKSRDYEGKVLSKGTEMSLENRTTLRWEWNELDEGREPEEDLLELSTMDDVVSVMIPLIFANAHSASLLTETIRLTSLMTDSDDSLEVAEEVKFTALYSLKTDSYEKQRPKSLTDDVRPLSRSLVAHERLLGSDRTLNSSTQDWSSLPARSQMVVEAQASFQELDKKIKKEWTIDQQSITIKCELYVWTVAIACAFLVAGGIAIGVTVKNRIRGVDPFGITTFCWVLAAFIILVAKSIYVENWPWRDFLLRRVVCRSVTELSSVTRVREQDIITYLLHNESSTILVTKGPYNTTFVRGAESGFSIDVKPKLRTMLLSGLVVVKVATIRGPALVSLSVRKGRAYVGFDHSYHGSDKESHLACVQLPQKRAGERDNYLKDPELTLTRVRLGWNRVLGVYNLPNSTFR